MKTLSLIALVVLCITSLVWFFMSREHISPSPIACTMEAKICPDGTTVGRTGLNCEFAECPPVENVTPVDNVIMLDAPLPNQKVSSPITLSGKARGTWFFEGSFPIVIVNWDGLIIGEGHATAQGEWMTTEFVPFTAVVSYSIPENTPYYRGAIILKKDNPSGLPEHDDSREIPILFE